LAKVRPATEPKVSLRKRDKRNKSAY